MAGLRAINPAEVWAEIVDADQRFLLPAAAATLLTNILRGIRWRLCFARDERVTVPEASTAYAVGAFSAQTVVPARLGDLVRVYVLGQVSGASTSRALGTLVIERLADLFTVVILLAMLLPLFSLPSWIKVADGFAAGVAVAALVVVYLLSLRSERLRDTAWLPAWRPLQVVFRLFVQVLEGFSAVRDPRRALLILLTSAALWIVQTGTYALSFAALHIPLGWKEGALTTAVLALTAIIPTGPGFAGSFELATQQLLALFAVDRTLATGYQEYTRIVNLLGAVVYVIAAFAALKLWQSRRSVAVQPALD